MWARSSRGFTLLELIVTLFIVALTVGLAVPLVGRTSDSIRARSDVARFSAVLRHAREQAITSREPRAVVIDPVNRRMLLFAGDPGGDVRETRPLPEQLRVEATPPPALTVRFEPQGTSTGGDYRVTSGTTVYRVTVDPITGRVRSTRQ